MRNRRRRKLNIYTEPVTTYLTKQQKREIQNLCKRTNRSMSELLRLGIIENILHSNREENSNGV